MDGVRFDHLIKQLATRRLPRLRAIQGFAAAVTSLMAVGRASDQAEGAKGKPRKKTICNCANTSVASCSTLKTKKKRAKKLLASNRCAYTGACRNFNPCSPPPLPPPACTTDGDCPASARFCVNGACVACRSTADCAGAETCEAGRCLCPRESQLCGDVCCPGEPDCNVEGVCRCAGEEKICSCSAEKELCRNAQCCLEEDTCDPSVGCVTEKCVAGNTVCDADHTAFCDAAALCVCVTVQETGLQACARSADFTACPPASQCKFDIDCDPGLVCADVSCCDPTEQVFVGVCTTLCT